MPGPGQTTSGSKGWTEMDQKSESYTKESFPGYSGLLLEVRGYMLTKTDLHTFPHMQQETLSPSHESGSFVLKGNAGDRGNGSHQVLYRLVKWVASHLLTAEPVTITVAAKPTW